MRVLPWLLLLGCTTSPAGPDAARGPATTDTDGAVDTGERDTDCAAWSWSWDADGDGVGDASIQVLGCEWPGEGWTSNAGDCDDTDPRRFPGNPERCDAEGIDEDCDGRANDDDPQGATDASTWYADEDGDGWGDESLTRCEQPEGAVTMGGDCDDGDPAVYPGAVELCAYDGIDEDCDGSSPWYVDEDGDGWGTAVFADCVGPMAPETGDCDDADPARSPGEPEICVDGIDQTCDGNASACGIEGVYDFRPGEAHADLSVHEVGDLDGDGWADLLVGSFPSWLYVIPGPFGPAPFAVDEAVVRIELSFATHGAFADLDGDGRAEILVGSSQDAWIHVGLRAGDVLDTDAAWRLQDVQLGSVFDSDGDGDDEIALIGNEDGWTKGPVWLINGSGPRSGVPANIALATFTDTKDLAHLGDIDGDGVADAAWVADGSVAVLHGPMRGVFDASDADVALAPVDGTRLPRVPRGAGDLDGDGRDDLVVTVQLPPSALRDHCPDTPVREVLVFEAPLPTSLADADATLEATLWIEAAHGAGDLDGDGRGELVLTRRGCDPTPTRAYVLPGPLEGAVELDAARAELSLRGADPPMDVIPADLDGDGVGDLAVSANRQSWLLFGGPGL